MKYREVSVFVNCKKPHEKFVQQIEPILGFQMTSNTNNVLGFRDHEILYVYSNIETHRGFIILPQNYLSNDGDLNFEDCDYEIRCYSVDTGYNFAEETRIADEFAQWVFNRLKATNQYRLMLVDDIQIKLDEYAPEQGDRALFEAALSKVADAEPDERDHIE